MSRSKTCTPPRPAGAPPEPTEAKGQRIFIRDLQLPCRIGVTKSERRNRQRLAINLDLEIEPRRVRKDRISEVVDYTDIIAEVRSIALESEFRLLESLAEQLAQACFFHPRIVRVRVRVEKLDLVSEAAGVGIEIDRRRPAKV
ncbi:MAG: dihydroneopterin aldolase [Kiloniellales bacterium]|nr:dihydroneopterin aldolase [Kiloniellales bacterium]MDJ0969025.1 dihydroneopterin aldolase [Kiloniellales bacterium]